MRNKPVQYYVSDLSFSKFQSSPKERLGPQSIRTEVEYWDTIGSGKY